jgi:acyl carrier protein
MSNPSVHVSPAGDFVLAEVIATLREMAGNDQIEIDATSNLVTLLDEIDDSLGLLEFHWKLEERFIIDFSQEEFSLFFWPRTHRTGKTYQDWQREVAPTLTVSAFADFIRDRIKPISFEPISVLGSDPCPAAGYFVGMSEIVNQLRPDTERFGPSTPITRVLPASSQLRTFWRRLSRAANRALPPLTFWLNHLANVLLLAAAACLLFGVFVNWAFLATVWLLCVKVLQFGWWLRKRANPLPRGIVTFGDLSRHLARETASSGSQPTQ